MELFRAARCSLPHLWLTDGVFSLLLALRFHSDARSSWHLVLSWRWSRCWGSLHSLYHPSLLLTWRNGLYDSTFCSKLSFKAHLGVLRSFSTCQLIWDTPLQKSCFFTFQLNKTRNRYPLWGRRYVTLQRHEGKPDAVPVSKRLRVKGETQKDKCKAACKNSTKEGHHRAGHLHLGAGGGRVASWRKRCLSKCFTLVSFIPFIHPPHSIPFSSPTGSHWQCVQMSFFAWIVLRQNTYCHFTSVDLVLNWCKWPCVTYHTLFYCLTSFIKHSLCEHLGCSCNLCLFPWVAHPSRFTFPLSPCGTSIVVPIPTHSAVTHFTTHLWISVKSSLNHIYARIWLLGHRYSRQNNGSKDVYFLIPRMGECVAWQGKRSSADVIKNLKRRGDELRFSRWVQSHHRRSYERRKRQKSQRFEDTTLLALKMEEGAISQEIKGSMNQVASGSQKRQEGVVKVKVAQLCPTLCKPMDCIVHGILQARILEWVAFPFSRGSSQPRNWTQVSPLEPPEETRPCEHLDFTLVRPLLDFQPLEVYSDTWLLL